MSDTEKEIPIPDPASDTTKLDALVEATIALEWGDHAAAAQLTRQVARAMMASGQEPEEIRERIVNNGRIVD